MTKDTISSGHSDAECYAIFYGTKSEVEKKRDDYLRQYHPHGYNTQVTFFGKSKKTGEWCCRLSRWHSCD